MAQDTDTCIAASEKALTLRKARALIEERAALSTCAASACPGAVRSSCQQRLADVIEAIPSIIFFAKDGAGHDLATVTLSIDGAPHGPLDGIAIVLNPGTHAFRFEVAGQGPVTQQLILHEGERNRREEIVIGPPPPKTEVPDSSAKPLLSGAGAVEDHRSDEGNPRRSVGLVVGGVGLVSLAAGALFGGLSIAAHDSYEKSCGANIGAPPGQCNAQGVHGESDAATKGNVSTVLLVSGGVLAVTGAILLFTAPDGHRNAQIGFGPRGLVFTGQL